MPSDTTLSASHLRGVRSGLKRAHAALRRRHPGEAPVRQPVHVLYGGAHLFGPDMLAKVARLATESFNTYAKDAKALASALELPEPVAQLIYPRIVEKLSREPIEDYRIDFEDGYGPRPDAEEDAHAVSAAKALAEMARAQNLPPYIGIRVKSFSKEASERALRTLDLFLTTFAAQGVSLPGNFVVTLPKVQSREQVKALVQVLTLLERRLPIGRKLPIELMVETPESVVAPDGTLALASLVSAAERRCRGAHFGTYDFTAALNVSAAHQSMEHPGANLGRQVMQLSLAGSGVWLSDGATNLMPVAPHKGKALGAKEQEENRAAVHRAWRESYRHIRASLSQGFYQGWDLHPAQLPVRYAALFAFFVEALPETTARLSAFLKKAAQASLVGGVFDDAATGQGLLNFFLRGRACGAISEAEVEAAGLTLEQLRTRSFQQIVAGQPR